MKYAHVLKYNPNHDPETGEFSSAGGGSSGATEHILVSGSANGQWVHEGGTPVAPEVATRLKELGVPPAWTDVKLNADPTHPLQVTGKDSAGRTQYKYSAAHSEAAAAEKFARVQEFHKELPSIREKIGADLKNPALPVSQRDSAAVLALIEKTGFRIGSDRETGAKVQAYGISTLTTDHIRVAGGKISLDFVGKSGKNNVKTVQDPSLASYLTAKISGLESGSKVFSVSDSSVRSYMKTVTDPSFSPKDFRTWHGTNEALRLIEGMPTPTTKAEYTKARNAVGDAVSSHLGNTRAIALGSYIDPGVFGRWGIAPAKKTEGDPNSWMDDYFATTSYDSTGEWRGMPEDDPDDESFSEVLKK